MNGIETCNRLLSDINEAYENNNFEQARIKIEDLTSEIEALSKKIDDKEDEQIED